MWKQLIPGLRLTLLLTVLTGLAYPLLVTGLCQTLFTKAANGSLIERNGKVVGSALIGQNFTKPEYFQPRPSAAGADGYDAGASGGSNLGPTSQKLADRVKTAAARFRRENPAHGGRIPADLLTTSASGLDPHISPEAAAAQLTRVAQARNADVAEVREVVEAFTAGPELGLLGEPRVNVLLLNLALDSRLPVQK
jgi:K+-transporting ATPase ATPase C chain